MNVTITDAPFATKEGKVKWKDFLAQFLDYIQDHEDVQNVLAAKKSADTGISLDSYLDTSDD